MPPTWVPAWHVPFQHLQVAGRENMHLNGGFFFLFFLLPNGV